MSPVSLHYIPPADAAELNLKRIFGFQPHYHWQNLPIDPHPSDDRRILNSTDCSDWPKMVNEIAQWVIEHDIAFIRRQFETMRLLTVTFLPAVHGVRLDVYRSPYAREQRELQKEWETTLLSLTAREGYGATHFAVRSDQRVAPVALDLSGSEQTDNGNDSLTLVLDYAVGRRLKQQECERLIQPYFPSGEVTCR